MDPITMLAAGSILSPIVGGVLGNVLGNDDKKKAEKARADALQNILSLEIPDIEKQKLALEHLSYQGDVNPEVEADIINQNSKMEGVSTDPRLRQAQLSALAQLQEQGRTGLSAQDRVALQQTQNQVNQQAQARQEAILQDMQARGAGGSGSELAARLSASQAAANSGMMEGMNINAMAQQKALQALAQAGALGGQIRGQDFSEAGDKAKAQDAINQFNTQNRLAVQARNVASRNQAAYRNQDQRQRISDTNIGLNNQEQIHNKGLYQQQFDNEFKKRAAAADAYHTDAKASDMSAQTTADMWSGIGQGVGKGAGTIAATLYKRQ